MRSRGQFVLALTPPSSRVMEVWDLMMRWSRQDRTQIEARYFYCVLQRARICS
jgi:hypothetical protein